MSLLDVRNLSVFFKSSYGESIAAVDDISFSLEENEVLGIVGESGSGKSVTSLSILGLLPYPNAYHSDKSSIIFNDMELCNAGDENLQKIRGKDISFIFQEPMSSLNPLHTIEKQISEALTIHIDIDKKSAKKKVLELLKSTGIQNARERMKSYPFELSGGQRQRVMIAMAIANNPKILIADEPTTALDVTVQSQILELLMKLKVEHNMSIIFISHDLNVIKKIADKVCVMKDGKIVETGKVDDVFNKPKSAYTKKLIESSFMKRMESNATKQTVLKAENIKISFPIKKNFWGRVVKELKAVNDVSFELKSKETLGIVGESGSGKTTLGLAVSNLINYDGKTYLNGEPINKYDKNFRKKLQIVFQDPYNSLNPRMNIEQIIAEGLDVHFPKMSKTEKSDRIYNVLDEVGLSRDVILKYPHEFSGGQRQRIAIARALILEPEVLVLDEPTSALDVTIQKQIIELLNKIQQKQSLSYVFISHDMSVIRAVSDRVMVMKDGKIVETGKCSELFKNQKTEYTKKLITSSF